METIASVFTAAAILSGGASIIVTAQTSAHVVQTPQEGQWGAAPPLLPPALTFGMGDKLMKNGSGNKTLGVGGFALMPAKMNHFALTTGAETERVLYGQGPIDFTYVNPADDPRKVKASTR